MLLRFQFGLWQGFNWESWKSPCWYDVIAATANDLAEAGVTDVWFPPASHSVAPQGIWISEYIQAIYCLNLSQLSHIGRILAWLIVGYIGVFQDTCLDDCMI